MPTISKNPLIATLMTPVYPAISVEMSKTTSTTTHTPISTPTDTFNTPPISPSSVSSENGGMRSSSGTKNTAPHIDTQAESRKKAVSAGPLATRVAVLANPADGILQKNPALSTLQERHAVYQNMIATHQSTIATLDTEIVQIDQKIQQKTASADQLLKQKTDLVSRIEDERDSVKTVAFVSAFLTAFGLGSVAGAARGTATVATAALINLENSLTLVEQEKVQAEAELKNLRELSSNYQKNRATLQTSLQTMRDIYTDLQIKNPIQANTPLDTLEILQKAVSHDQKIVENLETQIVLLQDMKKIATGHEVILGTMIDHLQKNVDGLKQQLTQINRQLWSSLIDVAILGGGASATLRMGGLTLAKKELILAAVDVSHGDTDAIINLFMKKLLNEGLVEATGSTAMATILRTLAAPTSSSIGVSAGATTTNNGQDLVKATLRAALHDPKIVGNDAKMAKMWVDLAAALSTKST